MTPSSVSKQKWVPCFVLVFTALSSEVVVGAAPSLSHVTSAITSQSNHRPSRSITNPESGCVDESGGQDDCSLEFVGKFSNLFSGPFGNEAEGFPPTVRKLLLENDRANWPTMTDIDRFYSSDFRRPRIFLPGESRVYDHNAASLAAKRGSPKFNPTGWRRKREMPSGESSFGRLLQGLFYPNQKLSVSMGKPSKSLALQNTEIADDVTYLDGTGWQNEKRTAEQRRVPDEFKPKRKHLEFNPTGW